MLPQKFSAATTVIVVPAPVVAAGAVAHPPTKPVAANTSPATPTKR
jgi:hypothetical protein